MAKCVPFCCVCRAHSPKMTFFRHARHFPWKRHDWNNGINASPLPVRGWNSPWTPHICTLPRSTRNFPTARPALKWNLEMHLGAGIDPQLRASAVSEDSALPARRVHLHFSGPAKTPSTPLNPVSLASRIDS